MTWTKFIISSFSSSNNALSYVKVANVFLVFAEEYSDKIFY